MTPKIVTTMIPKWERTCHISFASTLQGWVIRCYHLHHHLHHHHRRHWSILLLLSPASLAARAAVMQGPIRHTAGPSSPSTLLPTSPPWLRYGKPPPPAHAAGPSGPSLNALQAYWGHSLGSSHHTMTLHGTIQHEFYTRCGSEEQINSKLKGMA